MSDTTPLSAYRAKLASGELTADPAQARAVEQLQGLHHALVHYQPHTGQSGWKRRFGLGRQQPGAPQGLYLYGGVGRGKSLLMDMFFASAPVERKRRVHFHAFMGEVHERFNALSKQGRDDPVPPVASVLASQAWLLCFDEFQVTDIADAMILGRLFEGLFKRGVVVVSTSNRPPTDLYKDGLQRARFLPFIDMIQEKLEVLHLAGGTDYRALGVGRGDLYLTPAGAAADAALGRTFQRLTGGAMGAAERIAIKGRHIHIPLAADGVAWAGFEDLCGQALGPGDLLEIAARYHTLILSDIPQLTPAERDKAKRFVILIDALYEAHAHLICSAAAAPDALYDAGDGSFEFGRTASRLKEMQSEGYFMAAKGSL